jgi:polyisoprenoid-binding protein YceI
MRGSLLKSLVILSVVALAPLGCGKKGEKSKPKPAPAADAAVAKTAPTPPPTPTPTPPAPTPTPPPDDKADYVRVLGTHNPPKETDPVTLSFGKFTVVKADFDPAKVEGGSAEIQLDAASITSDSQKRTDHIQSDSYLDVAKFPTITVKVSGVKKTGDNAYSAIADVSAHGVSVTKWPVTFQVIETLPDGIRIKGSHKFKRTDFKVGQAEVNPDPKKADSTQEAIEIQLQLTLKKT